ASLQKYKRMIDAWGGWALFQELLSTLEAVGERHGATIAAVATRYIMDRPAVAAPIIGVRLGESEHLHDNAAAFDLKLTSEEVAQIEASSNKGRDLLQVIGDCGDEYR